MSKVSLHETTVPNFVERLAEAFHEGDPDSTFKAAEADNVRRLQDVYRALARGDFGPFVNLLADDVEMEMLGPPDMPMAGRWRGKPQVVEAVGQNFGLLEEQQAQILTLAAQGDTLVFFARERGRLRATGKWYDMHWVQIFTFRGGKVAHFRCLPDTAALMEAARPD